MFPPYKTWAAQTHLAEGFSPTAPPPWPAQLRHPALPTSLNLSLGPKCLVLFLLCVEASLPPQSLFAAPVSLLDRAGVLEVTLSPTAMTSRLNLLPRGCVNIPFLLDLGAARQGLHPPTAPTLVWVCLSVGETGDPTGAESALTLAPP